jgi:hypothetical protein
MHLVMGSTLRGQGQFVINPQFSWATSFSEGLAAVQVGNEEKGKSGFIDKQGKFDLAPESRIP